jgi:hypothetical protein
MNNHDKLWEIQNQGGRVYCLEGLTVEEATTKAHEMGIETIGDTKWLIFLRQ